MHHERASFRSRRHGTRDSTGGRKKECVCRQLRVIGACVRVRACVSRKCVAWCGVMWCVVCVCVCGACFYVILNARARYVRTRARIHSTVSFRQGAVIVYILVIQNGTASVLLGFQRLARRRWETYFMILWPDVPDIQLDPRGGVRQLLVRIGTKDLSGIATEMASQMKHQ